MTLFRDVAHRTTTTCRCGVRQQLLLLLSFVVVVDRVSTQFVMHWLRRHWSPCLCCSSTAAAVSTATAQNWCVLQLWRHLIAFFFNSPAAAAVLIAVLISLSRHGNTFRITRYMIGFLDNGTINQNQRMQYASVSFLAHCRSLVGLTQSAFDNGISSNLAWSHSLGAKTTQKAQLLLRQLALR